VFSGGEEAECISYDKLFCLVANTNAANSGGLQFHSCRKTNAVPMRESRRIR
jgi:hypothetical protein